MAKAREAGGPVKMRLEGLRLRQGGFELHAEAELGHKAIGIAGPSGSGKTSLLELIGGLRSPQAGRLLWDGRVLDDPAKGVALPARQRQMGYVPQDADLFPHLGVEANLRFGSERGQADGTSFSEVIGLLGLAPLLRRGASDLSGGERRRVALGRALLSGPQLLLLDEPFTGLDLRAKRDLRRALKALRSQLGLPLILVSHEAADLRELCDQVLVMKNGSLKQK